MKRAWLLALLATAACGHAASPGTNVALGPTRACQGGAVDDGFECIAKHTTGEPLPADDGADEGQDLAKTASARPCDPFGEDCDESVPGAAALTNEADYFAHALKSYQSHDYPQARRLFFEMLQKYPNGVHPDDAYFYFGRMFEAEGQIDPSKLPLAAQSFEQVLTYPTSTQRLAAGAALVRVYGQMHDPVKQQLTIERFRKMGPPQPRPPQQQQPPPPRRP
ncbi:MAG: hypothetical protein ABI551_05150 [Polyangiaceae bacterium]